MFVHRTLPNVAVLCALLLAFRLACSFLGLPPDGTESVWLVCTALLLIMLCFRSTAQYSAIDGTAAVWLCVGLTISLDALTLACGAMTNGSIRHLGVLTSSLWSSCLFSVALGIRLATRNSVKENAVLLLAFVAHVFLLAAQPNLAAVLLQILACLVLAIASSHSVLRTGLLAGSAGLAAVAGWFIASRPYMMYRLQALFDPHSDSLGAGFQMLQYRKAFQLAGLSGTDQALALPGSQASSVLPFLALSLGNIVALGVVAVAFTVYAALFFRIRRLENPSVRNGLMGAWVLLALMHVLAVAFSFGMIGVSGNAGILFIGSAETACVVLLLALAARPPARRLPDAPGPREPEMSGAM